MTPNDPSTLIDRRDYLRLTGGLAAAATAGLAGCSGSVPGSGDGDGDGSGGGTDGSTATGLLSTAVSDNPGDIADFESCIVTLDGIWVGPKAGSEGGDEEEEEEEEESGGNDTDESDETEAGDGGGPPERTATNSSDDPASGSQDDGNQTDTDGGNETDAEPDEEEMEDEETDGEDDDGEDGDGEDGDSGGRTYYEFDQPQEADLTELQGEAQQLVGEHELEVGTYQFLQLDVAGVRGTLTDGSEADVTTPGNAPLKFNQSFDVREGYRTTFLADFTPVKRGNGSYIFQPVAKETEVSYHEIEGGNGSGDSTNDSTTDDGNTSTVDGDEPDTSDGNETSDGGNQTSA